MKSVLFTTLFLSCFALTAAVNELADWPEEIRASNQRRCLHFGDDYVFTIIDIDTQKKTYRRKEGQCRALPIIEYGNLQLEGNLKKIITKTCVGESCTEVEPKYDGHFSWDGDMHITETSSDGNVRGSYLIW